MTHELNTRRNRRVCHSDYVPSARWEDDEDDELLALEEELEHSRSLDWQPNCFIRFMERFPYFFILTTLVSAGVCAGLLYKFAPVPDFLSGKNPTKGFETRGTDIHRRAFTLKNLFALNDVDYFLAPNASMVTDHFNLPLEWLGSKRKRRSLDRFRRDTPHNHSRDTPKNISSQLPPPSDVDNCPPLYIYNDLSLKVAYEVKHNGDLLTLKHLQAMCELEDRLLVPLVTNVNDIASLPRIILCLRGKPYSDKGCSSLTEQDVLHFRFLLSQCSTLYYNKTLIQLTGQSLCADNSFLLQSFFHNMAPVDFYNPSQAADKSSRHLRTVLSYISWRQMLDLDAKTVYKEGFANKYTSNKDVKLVALNVPGQMNVKYDLFSEYLVEDVEKYFSLALMLILVIMAVYTRSIVLMLATVLNVAISFTFACTIYFFVFKMDFFPFINLLAGLVLIAVGADDVFIFYDTWKQTRSEQSDLSLAQALSKTYSHAALSIFVTSLTTASAFLTNIVSNSITCIRCFGVFAGLAILINFFVMVTWTPAVVICIEKVWLRVQKCSHCLESVGNRFNKATSRLCELVYSKCLPVMVGKAWFLWLFVLLAAGIGSSVVVFVKPKLQLPRSKDFQLFPASNLLENWDLHFESVFPFQQSEQSTVPLYFLFGFKAEDNGNKFDPDDLGQNVTEVAEFNIYSNASQLWLEAFCEELKNQTFVGSWYKDQPCGLATYGAMFKQYCKKPLYRQFIGNCCENYEPPYSQYQLQWCLPGLQVLMRGHLNLMGTPIYDASNTIKGFMMFTHTNLNISLSYDGMDINYRIVQRFFDKQIETAPANLDQGFFTGLNTFILYDIQGAIAKGTYMSIELSLAIAFVIMFLTSMNLLLTLYAILTIGGAIVSTVACIVLMGWELNIIESITISLAVGLSIDFTIHYGMAYRLAEANDQQSRVNESFSRVGSAVAMAALTTFAAGAAMMPSRVIAYTKLGIFLMLVMAFSWIYATFFFQSICRILGPRGRFCQIPAPSCKRKVTNGSLQVEDGDDSMITF